ncbi:unnamed protein product [Victoria cruziana]
MTLTRYCVCIAITSSIYSALQLFKGICDFASGVPQLVFEKVSNYTTFMLDQVIAYLLMSSSSTILVSFDNKITAHQCGKLAAASLVLRVHCYNQLDLLSFAALQGRMRFCFRSSTASF